MKSNELKSLRAKDIKELEKALKEKNLKLIETRAGRKVSKNKNLKQVKILRRDISQIATILTEKSLVEELKMKNTKEKGVEE